MDRRRTHPAFLAWAEATATCLALRRAAIRALHPRATPSQVEARLRDELDAIRARRDADYLRNA